MESNSRSGATTTWGYWTSTCSGTASTDSATTWATRTTDGTSAATTNTWTIWCVASSDCKTVNYFDGKRKQITAEQAEQRRLEAERQAAEWRAAEEKRRAEEVKAEATAKELLDAFLTPEQQQTMEKINAIAVKSQNNKTYLVKKGERVQELNDAGKVVAEYCIVPQAQLPLHDRMLIQKLMLENNEAEFLKTANRTPRL